MEIKVSEIYTGTFEVLVGEVEMCVEVNLGLAYDSDLGTDKRYVYQECKGDIKVSVDATPMRVSEEAQLNIKRAINTYLHAE